MTRRIKNISIRHSLQASLLLMLLVSASVMQPMHAAEHDCLTTEIADPIRASGQASDRGLAERNAYLKLEQKLKDRSIFLKDYQPSYVCKQNWLWRCIAKVTLCSSSDDVTEP